MSEPIPAWGNLLRHAEGRLESDSFKGIGVPGADGCSRWDLWYGSSGEFQKAVAEDCWGLRDNINAWNFELIRLGNRAC